MINIIKQRREGSQDTTLSAQGGNKIVRAVNRLLLTKDSRGVEEGTGIDSPRLSRAIHLSTVNRYRIAARDIDTRLYTHREDRVNSILSSPTNRRGKLGENSLGKYTGGINREVEGVVGGEQGYKEVYNG